MLRTLLLMTLIAFSHGNPRMKRQSYGQSYQTYPSYNYGQQNFGGYYDNQQQPGYWSYQNEAYQNNPYNYWQQDDYSNYNQNNNNYWKGQMNTNYQQQPRVNPYVRNGGQTYGVTPTYQNSYTTAAPYRNSYMRPPQPLPLPPVQPPQIPPTNYYNRPQPPQIPPTNSYNRPQPPQIPPTNSYRHPQPSLPLPIPPVKLEGSYNKPRNEDSYNKALPIGNKVYVAPIGQQQQPYPQGDPIPRPQGRNEMRPSVNPQYPLSSNFGQQAPNPPPMPSVSQSRTTFEDRSVPMPPVESNNGWSAGDRPSPPMPPNPPTQNTFLDSAHEVQQTEVAPSDHVIGARSQQSLGQQTKPSEEDLTPPVPPPWSVIPIPTEPFKPRGWPGFEFPSDPAQPMAPVAAPVAADVQAPPQPAAPIPAPSPVNDSPMVVGMERPPDPEPAATPPPRPPMPVQSPVPSFPVMPGSPG